MQQTTPDETIIGLFMKKSANRQPGANGYASNVKINAKMGPKMGTNGNGIE